MSRPKARLLTRRDRDRALDHLRDSATENLLLFDITAAVGAPAAPSEAPSQVLAVWQDDEVRGLVSLRPSLILEHRLDTDTLEPCLPFLQNLDASLVKSDARVVDLLWDRLFASGRRALVDRTERAYWVRASGGCWSDPVPGSRVRPAEQGDLEALVVAARASLREEGRPDPFDGDPAGFRRWVAGRLPRARVVEEDGRIVFVGYADVQRPEGWLIQGVYTWPEARRRGHARAGMSRLCHEAFEAGADHVQLAVIDDNAAAIALYHQLGFEPFAPLRTILFC